MFDFLGRSPILSLHVFCWLCWAISLYVKGYLIVSNCSCVFFLRRGTPHFHYRTEIQVDTKVLQGETSQEQLGAEADQENDVHSRKRSLLQVLSTGS